MAHLLHIDTSPRSGSFSRELSAAFASAWRAEHPDGGYTHRDLAADPVPPVDEPRTEIARESSVAGVRTLAEIAGVIRTPAQEASWAVCRPLIEELLAADTLLIATPMYNFTVPSTLKAWIDQISFPWLPMADKRAIVVTARGGTYAPGTPREGHDFQEPYLRTYFETLGLTDLHFVNTELTNALHVPFHADFTGAHEASRAAALSRVAELAASIGRRLEPTN